MSAFHVLEFSGVHQSKSFVGNRRSLYFLVLYSTVEQFYSLYTVVSQMVDASISLMDNDSMNHALMAME